MFAAESEANAGKHSGGQMFAAESEANAGKHSGGQMFAAESEANAGKHEGETKVAGSDKILNKIEEELSKYNQQIYEQVEIDAKYAGYLKREYEDIAVFKRDENLKIRDDINYAEIGGLSTEMVQRFTTVRPKTIGEAMRITGVTPAAVTAILGYLKND